MRYTTTCLAVLLVSLTLLSPQAEGRTPPLRGAANKPRSFEIQTPFPCGTEVRVLCGYGPNCSPAHKRTKSPGSTNDHFALDLARAERGNGARKPVVAVAAGTVRVAGWARAGWAPYGKVVYIEHDYRGRRGEKFHSLYAHLDSVQVRVGQRVEANAVIGTLGGSSKHRRSAFGPHLHFAIYTNARDTLGGGRAVVPEPLDANEDLRSGVRMTACAAAQPDVFAAKSQPDQTTPAAGGLVR